MGQSTNNLEPKIIRLIDANLNRAAEGLRVVEDVCRFILDNAETAGQLKSMRHEIRSLYPNEEELVRFRDTENDIGKQVEDYGSDIRENLSSVVRANLKRAQEALRVLEECEKLLSPPIQEKAEHLRYRCYEMEKQVLSLIQDYK